MGVSERRVRERENRISLILDAALGVFTTRGLHDGTMEEIAEAAALGKATLYYYFPSKEGILCALVERTIVQHFEGIRERVREARTPLEAVAAMITGFAANYRRSPELFRLIYMLMVSPPEEACNGVHSFAQNHRRWLKELEGDVEQALEGTRISPATLVTFTGTHIHGMNLLTVSGRDLESLVENTISTMEELLGATGAVESRRAS